jgi:hypothetical protein
LFGGSAEGLADPRKSVAELFENDTEDVVGLMEDPGLPLNDEMVEMRFSHEDLFKLSRSLLSTVGDVSWSVLDMSDRRAPTELCREIDGVEAWNGDELPDILLQKPGLRPVPCDVNALGRSMLDSNLSGSDWVPLGEA